MPTASKVLDFPMETLLLSIHSSPIGSYMPSPWEILHNGTQDAQDSHQKQWTLRKYKSTS